MHDTPRPADRSSPPHPHGETAVLIAKAMAGAARVLEAEMNGTVTYVSQSTVLGLAEDKLAERWLVKANDWIYAWLDAIRIRRTGIAIGPEHFYYFGRSE